MKRFMVSLNTESQYTGEDVKVSSVEFSKYWTQWRGSTLITDQRPEAKHNWSRLIWINITETNVEAGADDWRKMPTVYVWNVTQTLVRLHSVCRRCGKPERQVKPYLCQRSGCFLLHQTWCRLWNPPDAAQWLLAFAGERLWQARLRPAALLPVSWNTFDDEEEDIAAGETIKLITDLNSLNSWETSLVSCLTSFLIMQL